MMSFLFRKQRVTRGLPRKGGRSRCRRLLASESLERRRLLSSNDGSEAPLACFCSGCIPVGGEALVAPEPFSPDLSPAEARIPPSGDARIDALRSPQGYIWGTSAITYSFYAGGGYYGSESSPQPVSEAVKANVRYIFSEILQPLLDLTFTEVTDTPTDYGLMRFLGSTSAAYAYAYYPTAGDTNRGTSIDVVGDVVLNPRNDVAGGDLNARINSFQSGPGSHGFSALIHEIGHALGLKHPFADSPTLPASQDNQDNTVMTYTFEGSSPSTLMPYDVLALQYFYGVNPATRADDTTYVFTAVDAFTPGSGSTNAPSPIFGRTKHLLWDSGGVDRVDLAQLPANGSGYRIDVQPGGWITTSTAFNSVNYGGSNFVTDFGTRIPLAGAVIENVSGSRSSDAIYLNTAANRVSGYAPATASGNDVVHGSNQSDTLDLSSFARSSVTESQVGNDLILGLGASGTVTIKDYFAAPTTDRMKVEYQPDASIRITSDRPSLRVGETAQITFSFGMSTTNFTVADVTTVGGVLSNFTGSGSSYSATFTPLPNFQGTGSLSIAAGVFTGTNGTPNLAASLDLPIDTVAPTVSITRRGSGTLGIGSSDQITFTLSDSVPNFTATQVVVSGGILTGFSGSGRVFTAMFTPTADFLGTATIAVAGGVFTDTAGNPNLPSNTLEIPVDTASPSITISRSGSGTVTIGATLVIAFRVDTPTTDFTADDVTVTGGRLSGFTGSGMSYSATFTPDDAYQGTASIRVAAGAFTSLAGNPNRAGALDIPVDTAIPTLTITRSGNGPLTVGMTSQITFTISETGTTFSASAVTVTGGSLSGFTGSGTNFTATLTPNAGFEGNATIEVRVNAFRDSVGYGNRAASLSLPVDTAPPAVALSLSGPSSLKVGDQTTVVFTLSESSQNFGLQSIDVAGGVLTGLAGVGTRYSGIFVPAADFQGQASITVFANRFTDLAGNGNRAGNVLSIAVDTVSPRIVRFAAAPSTAALAIGDSIILQAEFSEPVPVGGSFVAVLDSGARVTLVVDGTGRIARGTYTAQPGDFSHDLDVVAIVPNGTIRNGSGNPLNDALPAAAAGLAANHSITVDARVKLLATGAFSTNPLFVRDVRGQFRMIPIRFTTPVSGLSLSAFSLAVDGQVVPLRGARLQGSGMSYLLLMPVTRVNPIGIYTLSLVAGAVRASSNGASATDQVSLYWGFQRSVGMVPDAPTGVVVHAVIQSGRRTSVAIGWQPASGRGGGPLTHYVAQYRVVGTSQWLAVRIRIPGSANSVTITNVTPDRLYEFRVAAVNSAGVGDFASSGPVSLFAVAGLPRPQTTTSPRA